MCWYFSLNHDTGKQWRHRWKMDVGDVSKKGLYGGYKLAMKMWGIQLSKQWKCGGYK